MTDHCPSPPRRPARRARFLATGLLAAWALAQLGGCALPASAPAFSSPAAAQPAPAPQPAAPLTLRVMAFNDFHGHLEAGNQSLSLPDPRAPGRSMRVATGGADALAGLVQALRAQAPASVLVASGDQVGAAPLISALFRHESSIDVLNHLGLDVATAGNHEFDAGTAELQRLLGGGCAPNAAESPIQSCAADTPNAGAYAGARFNTILANVQGPNGPLFAPAWVKQVGPVKVGFIGAVTRSTPHIVVPSGVAGLHFEHEAAAINRAARQLLSEGVQALVAVVHEGGELPRDPDRPTDWNDTRCDGFRGDIVEITRRLLPQIDLVLSAHTHQGYNCRVDGRPVMQAYAYGRGVSVADLVLDPVSGNIDRARSRFRNLPVLNAATEPAQREALLAAEPAPWAEPLRAARPDAAMAARVASYAAAVAPRAGRVVGQIAGGFDRRGPTDTAAGRLIADAQWAATRAPERGGAQLALMNSGGVRADLPCRGSPPCAVTYGDVFSVQPFGNSLVVMSLSGAELKALLEHQQPAGRESPSFLQPSAGLRYRWLVRAPQGQRVQDLRVDGRLVQPGDTLRVTVNSFMADGGDGLVALQQGRQRLGGAQDIDALMAYLAAPAPGGVAPDPRPRIEWVD